MLTQSQWCKCPTENAKKIDQRDRDTVQATQSTSLAESQALRQADRFSRQKRSVSPQRGKPGDAGRGRAETEA